MSLPSKRDGSSEDPRAEPSETGRDTEPARPLPSAPPVPRPTDLRAFLIENARAVSAVAFLLVGVVFVMLGWYGAAHTNIFTEQIPYLISGGLLGLGLIILAGFLAYAGGVEKELRALRQDLANTRPIGTVAAPAGASRNGSLYALPDGKSAHHAGCPIIEGKDGVRILSPDEAATLAPCKLCAPD